MVLLLAGPLAGLAAWTAQNVSSRPRTAAGPPPHAGPRHSPAGGRHESATLPATAIDRGEGPEQSRTLLISTGENGTLRAPR